MFAESSSLAWFYEETFRWGQLANIKEARRAVVVNALQPHAAIRSAAVQEASKQ